MVINVVTPDNLGADFITNASKYHSRSILSGAAAPVTAPPVTVKTWLWINTTTNKVTHYWNGSAWTVVGNASIFVTLAQLRAFTAADVAALPEVYITDAGKQGIFRYDSTDTTSADNTGTIVKLTASSHRYKRDYHEGVNISWFGATPNADSTTAFVNALLADDTVLVPDDTFLISSSLNIKLIATGRKRTVKGVGINSTLKASVNRLGSSGDWGAIFIVGSGGDFTNTSQSNILIKDLTLDCGGQTTDVYSGIQGVWGIYGSNCSDVTIDNVLVTNSGVATNSTNPVVVKADQQTGGFGIYFGCNQGEIRNIKLLNCTAKNIASGGNFRGDGFLIGGINTSLSIVPKGIFVSNCYAYNVGRHGFAASDSVGQSTGDNISFNNIYAENCSLCGFDFENAKYVNLTNFNFKNCGTYTGYFVPSDIYGTTYNLLAGVAFTNDSLKLNINNGNIESCYYGINCGASKEVVIDSVNVVNSTASDCARTTLGRFAENFTMSNCKLMTTNPSQSSFNLYNYDTSGNFRLINNVIYAPVTFAECYNVSLIGNSFKKGLIFSNNSCQNVLIQGNRFDNFAGKAIDFQASGSNLKYFKIVENEFIGTSITHGVFMPWNSLRESVISRNTFKGMTIAGIFHNNMDGITGIGLIADNHFCDMPSGIYIYQPGKGGSIINNTFNNISSWCVDFRDIGSALAMTGFSISGNKSLESCVHGLNISVAGAGSYDNVSIIDNNFSTCSGVKYSLAGGNLNGTNKGNIGLNTYDTLGVTVQGGNYTLLESDYGKLLMMNVSTANTVSVSADSITNFPIGTQILITSINVGQTTIVPLSGVTIHSNGNKYKLTGQFSSCTLIKIAANELLLNGDLTT